MNDLDKILDEAVSSAPEKAAEIDDADVYRSEEQAEIALSEEKEELLNEIKLDSSNIIITASRNTLPDVNSDDDTQENDKDKQERRPRMLILSRREYNLAKKRRLVIPIPNKGD